MTSKVKTDSTAIMGEGSDSGIETTILSLALSKPEGISNNDITSAMPDTPTKVWAQTINKLLKEG